MDEKGLIEAIVGLPGPGLDELVLGNGMDAAALRLPVGEALVCSVDAALLGVHLPERLGAEALGVKAVGAALSDLAALGARPLALLSSIVAPAGSADLALDLARAIAARAAELGTAVIGGNLAAGQVLQAHLTVLGARTEPICRRDAARAGDLLVVSGRFGGAAAGLALLLEAELGAGLGETLRAKLCERQLKPEPRLELGRRMVLSGVRAMIDCSDGLAIDASRLARASGLALTIDSAAVPREPGVEAVAAELDIDPWTLICSGEDYELIAAWPADASCPPTDLGLQVIGRFVAGSHGDLRGLPELVTTGWDHF